MTAKFVFWQSETVVQTERKHLMLNATNFYGLFEHFGSLCPGISKRLAFGPIHQHHLGHLIETYIADLLVSFQSRLGLAVPIVKFRPKPTREARRYSDSVGYVSLRIAEVTGSNLSRDFRFFTLKIY